VLDLDREFILRCIKERFGGKTARVVAAWPKGLKPVDRSTLWRWLYDAKVPKDDVELLSLAGALDLDPFSAWRIDAKNYPGIHNRALTASLDHSWSKKLLPALSFLEGFITPSVDWPPPQLARRYYRRTWTTFDYRQPATEHRDFYITFHITPRPDFEKASDQVWRFAWRPEPSAAWRPYGYVHLRDSQLNLFHYNGSSFHEAIRTDVPMRICVQTWIGPSPVDFRVTSLHRFQATVGLEPDGCSARVRFA